MTITQQQVKTLFSKDFSDFLGSSLDAVAKALSESATARSNLSTMLAYNKTHPDNPSEIRPTTDWSGDISPALAGYHDHDHNPDKIPLVGIDVQALNIPSYDSGNLSEQQIKDIAVLITRESGCFHRAPCKQQDYQSYIILKLSMNCRVSLA